MNKQLTLALAGILIVAAAVGGYAVANSKKSSTSASNTVVASAHDAAMVNLLKAQTGDAYDTMFITMMSEHHAGAVAMAQMVDTEAPHTEVRALATQIITAQKKELADMKAWAARWGYAYSEPSQSAVMAMSHGMDGRRGEALEKQFLNDMIGHHDGALDMATLSASRANHAEIMTLSANIEVTQAKEITEMKQLLQKYGYDSAETNEDHGSMMMH